MAYRGLLGFRHAEVFWHTKEKFRISKQIFSVWQYILKCLGLTRWFCYESETNEQPIRFNFDVELCRPILPQNQILCPGLCLHLLTWDPCIFHLYNVYQTWSCYILYNFTNVYFISINKWQEPTSFSYSLLLGQSQLKLQVKYFTVERAAKNYY